MPASISRTCRTSTSGHIHCRKALYYKADVIVLDNNTNIAKAFIRVMSETHLTIPVPVCKASFTENVFDVKYTPPNPISEFNNLSNPFVLQ